MLARHTNTSDGRRLFPPAGYCKRFIHVHFFPLCIQVSATLLLAYPAERKPDRDNTSQTTQPKSDYLPSCMDQMGSVPPSSPCGRPFFPKDSSAECPPGLPRRTLIFQRVSIICPNVCFFSVTSPIFGRRRLPAVCKTHLRFTRFFQSHSLQLRCLVCCVSHHMFSAPKFGTPPVVESFFQAPPHLRWGHPQVFLGSGAFSKAVFFFFFKCCIFPPNLDPHF